MTASEVLKLAYDILNEAEADNGDFTGYAPGIITVLLAETFAVNNNLRLSREKPELTEIPTVTAATMNEELPYEPEVLMTALPYGICEKYADSDGDTTRTGYFNSLYVNAVNYCQRGVSQDGGVEDLY